MPWVIVLVVFAVAACGSAGPPTHELTDLPFNIDRFTPEQTAVIRAGNEADTSSYYIQSRPVVFQIVLAGNDADETRETARINQRVEVLIYGLGEAIDGQLVDYGWVEHLDTGRRLWEMAPGNAVYAGGDPRNQKTVTRTVLEPGTYRLRYVSNGSHAHPDWEGAPPERPRLYGVTVFNMTALPLIEERLKQAGVAGLRSSLERP